MLSISLSNTLLLKALKSKGVLVLLKNSTEGRSYTEKSLSRGTDILGGHPFTPWKLQQDNQACQFHQRLLLNYNLVIHNICHEAQ